MKLYNIKNTLLNLENRLLTNDFRIEPRKIINLVHENFIELTTSGIIYKYSQGDVFGTNLKNTYILEESFSVRKLSSGMYQAIYQTNNSEGDIVNRSSIWKQHFTNWKIVFHQGTRARI